jgi:hypothetical protein
VLREGKERRERTRQQSGKPVLIYAGPEGGIYEVSCKDYAIALLLFRIVAQNYARMQSLRNCVQKYSLQCKTPQLGATRSTLTGVTSWPVLVYRNVEEATVVQYRTQAGGQAALESSECFDSSLSSDHVPVDIARLD